MSYIIQFDTASDLQVISTVFPPDTVDGPNRNTFYSSHLAYSYTTNPPLNIPPELRDYYYVMPPNSTGGFIQPNLLTYNAALALYQSTGPGDLYNVEVTIQLQGELASGEKLSSNKVTYSFQVFSSGFRGCRTGDVRVPSGPCGNVGGQDGSYVGCCKDFTPPLAGCPTGP